MHYDDFRIVYNHNCKKSDQ